MNRPARNRPLIQQRSRPHVLFQELLAVAAQLAEVGPRLLSLRQGLEGGLEVVQPLEAEQRLPQVPPAADLRHRAAGGGTEGWRDQRLGNRRRGD